MLTGLEKQTLCIKVQKYPNIMLEVLAIEFGIKSNTVYNIFAEKDIWLALDKNSSLVNSKCHKTVGFPTIESAFALWIEHAIYHEQAFTGEILKVKAQEFVNKMNINDFKASPRWITNFKKHHNISQFICQGEANSAPLENLLHFCNELQQLIQLYPIENIFNCDETVLFYHLNPIKTLAHGPVTGQKKAKDHIILMFTISIFKYWLCKLDEVICKSCQNILLFIDNASSYKINDNTTFLNITVYFLPPNCMAHLQSCDDEIIYSFKSQYRKYYCIDRIQKYDNTIAQNQSISNIPQTNIREAIEFVKIVWNQVNTKTITHAWQKMDIIPNNITVENEDLVLSTNMELIKLVNRFPINHEEVRMEASEFINSEDFISIQDMPTTESIIATIKEKDLLESEDSSIIKSIFHKLALEHINSLLLYITQDSD
ncbi:6447_t:CDS:2, partial [Acaulospora morrowiae]